MNLGVYCILFIVGQALYLLHRAAYAVRNPVNPVASRSDYIKRNWDILLYRAGLDQILFWAWAVYPDGLTRLLALTGMTVKIDLPLNPVTVVVAGLFSEVALDTLALKVKFLQTEIPTVPTGGVDVKQAKAEVVKAEDSAAKAADLLTPKPEDK